MLGQSNMVGHATVDTFQYLLDDMYRPSFEDVESQLSSSVFYGKVFSKYGLDLTEKMRRDPKNFTMIAAFAVLSAGGMAAPTALRGFYVPQSRGSEKAL